MFVEKMKKEIEKQLEGVYEYSPIRGVCEQLSDIVGENEQFAQIVCEDFANGRTKRIEVLRWAPEGFFKLAKYICKDTKEGKRKWNSTFNLIKSPQPRTSYSGKNNSKRKIADVAVQETLQKEYFEEILPDYVFAQSEVSFREIGDGCYIHARMYRKERPKK